MNRLEIALLMASSGLTTAAALLERQGTAKAKKLAKVLRSAHAGIAAYLDEE